MHRRAREKDRTSRYRDAQLASRQAQQFALRVHAIDLPRVMLGRDDALGHIVYAREIGPSVRDPEQAAPEVRAHAVPLHAMAQERPGLHRYDGGFMRPLLGKRWGRRFRLPSWIDQLVEMRAPVWPQPREGYLVMRRRQDVDEIDLQQAELPEDAGYIARAGRTPRPGPVETLRRQRHAARFA